MGEIVINEDIANRLNEDTTEEVNEVLTSEEITVTPSELEPVYNQVGELKGATVKKTRNRVQKATTSVSKTINPEDVVNKLKGQIAAIEVVAKVEVPEIPTIMVKEYREVLINLQKSVERVKTEAITAIQSA